MTEARAQDRAGKRPPVAIIAPMTRESQVALAARVARRDRLVIVSTSGASRLIAIAARSVLTKARKGRLARDGLGLLTAILLGRVTHWRLDGWKDPALAHCLKRHGVKRCGLYGCGIIPEVHLLTVTALNVHTGFCPQYRGTDTANWAIAGHDLLHVAWAILRPVACVDAGEVFALSRCMPRPDERFSEFKQRLHASAAAKLADLLCQDGEPQGLAQPTGIASVTYRNRDAAGLVQKAKNAFDSAGFRAILLAFDARFRAGLSRRKENSGGDRTGPADTGLYAVVLLYDGGPQQTAWPAETLRSYDVALRDALGSSVTVTHVVPEAATEGTTLAGLEVTPLVALERFDTGRGTSRPPIVDCSGTLDALDGEGLQRSLEDFAARHAGDIVGLTHCRPVPEKDFLVEWAALEHGIPYFAPFPGINRGGPNDLARSILPVRQTDEVQAVTDMLAGLRSAAATPHAKATMAATA